MVRENLCVTSEIMEKLGNGTADSQMLPQCILIELPVQLRESAGNGQVLPNSMKSAISSLGGETQLRYVLKNHWSPFWCLGSSGRPS